MGVGDGVFVFAAYQRLLALGATPFAAQRQLYGSEIDRSAFKRLLTRAKDLSCSFPHLLDADFFESDFPPVDVVIGNPPYVRRTYIRNVDHVRKCVTRKAQFLIERNLTRLADLYVYFLLYASAVLKPDGRLAAITADPWLNVGYGDALKRYFLQHFEIEKLISLDRPVFNNAEVKPVLTLAIKKQIVDSNRYVHFIRVRNGLPIDTLQQTLDRSPSGGSDITLLKIKSGDLDANSPWGIHFKAPELFQAIANHALMTPMSTLANTRIGLQTLAKEFFVLTREQARAKQIERPFLAPLAQSSRYFSEPVIRPDDRPAFYVFYCSLSKRWLPGTNARKHIREGERTKVQVRGKGISVVGYQNKERIKRSSRKLWYDLKTALERRGRAAILIPRLVYHRYAVVWNKAGFVPGELFIEFLPKSEDNTEVFLAILTSTVTETMLRARAQIYGGGTYNINPGQIKHVPILNTELLTSGQKQQLKQAYFQYLKDNGHDRSAIDQVIYEILDFDKDKQRKMEQVLADLLLMATSSREFASDCLQSVQK